MSKPSDVPAFIQKYNEHARDTVAKLDAEIKRLVTERNRIAFTVDGEVISIARTAVPDSVKRIGTDHNLMTVFLSNRGKRLTAGDIERLSPAPLRVRYLVQRHNDGGRTPVIHVEGEKRGKVYWID